MWSNPISDPFFPFWTHFEKLVNAIRWPLNHWPQSAIQHQALVTTPKPLSPTRQNNIWLFYWEKFNPDDCRGHNTTNTITLGTTGSRPSSVDLAPDTRRSLVDTERNEREVDLCEQEEEELHRRTKVFMLRVPDWTILRCTSSPPCATSFWGCTSNTPCSRTGPLSWCRPRRLAPAPNTSGGNPTSRPWTPEPERRWQRQFGRRLRGSAGRSRTRRWRDGAPWRSRPPRRSSPGGGTDTGIPPPPPPACPRRGLLPVRHSCRGRGDPLRRCCCAAWTKLGSRCGRRRSSPARSPRWRRCLQSFQRLGPATRRRSRVRRVHRTRRPTRTPRGRCCPPCPRRRAPSGLGRPRRTRRPRDAARRAQARQGAGASGRHQGATAQRMHWCCSRWTWGGGGWETWTSAASEFWRPHETFYEYNCRRDKNRRVYVIGGNTDSTGVINAVYDRRPTDHPVVSNGSICT